MLERRARPELTQSSSNKAKIRETVLVTVDEFKHILTKYCQRQARYQSSFSLAFISVLEFEYVVQNIGNQAAEQLNHLVRDSIFRNIRYADRVCEMGGGKFLILLPDTDKDFAHRTLDRLGKVLAGAKTHFQKRPLNASVEFKIGNSREIGANIEDLLSAIDCVIDEDGVISIICDKPSISSEACFTGGFESWAKRYLWQANLSSRQFDDFTVQCTQARDLWNGDNPIQIKTFELKESLTEINLESVAKKARVLQTIDHPGVVKVTDFHAKDARTIYLCSPTMQKPTLKIHLANGSTNVDSLLDWSVQVCNILIYLQNIVPPIIPTDLSLDHFTIGQDGHLELIDFEPSYLFADHKQEAGSTKANVLLNQAVASWAQSVLNLIEATEDTRKIKTLFVSLTKTPPPKDINNIYKVRSALRQLMTG